MSLAPTVALFGAALDVAERLELVDDPANDLLVAARAPRELGRARACLVEMGEDGAVEAGELAMAGLFEPRVEPVLHGEEEPGAAPTGAARRA